MFTKESTKAAIEECLTAYGKFDEEHDGRSLDKRVRVCLAGIDGGGLSTYGKSEIIESCEEYECRDEYLYIRRRREYSEDRCRFRAEKTAFVAYQSIIAIECEPKAVIR